ncbi:MFS general substrate transporter [Xylariaceae sp. FL0016]|nr:MFS general substrate transporter [Xylariaceae sp. FL0016]
MATEETPFLTQNDGTPRKHGVFSASDRVLVAGLLTSVALSFTQVPILFVFRLMVCEEFYGHHAAGHLEDRCSRSEIDAGTATQVSILGISTAFFGILNLLFAGWQIRTWGPRRALIVQTAFPALRVAMQVFGVSVGAKHGILIVQLSQLVSLVGGVSGYLLVLNILAGEFVSASQRTGMFGMLQGSVMLGTSIGYLLGGIVGDTWGIRSPFEMSTVLFTLSSIYAALFIPYIDPGTLASSNAGLKTPASVRFFGGFKVLLPRKLTLEGGEQIHHYGTMFLALGVFLGVLATGYAPILIQMYSTAAFNFLQTDNGYLMASNSLIRGMFLIVLFPRIISSGRRWFSEGKAKSVTAPISESVGTQTALLTTHEADASLNATAESDEGEEHSSGHAFDLFFLRWSLVVDGVITASTAFAVRDWHIYLAGILLPLASGSAPASKGVVTRMCPASERADALQAMTLIENMAMLSTLALFGFIFSAFSDAGKAYATFYCNAAVALVAVAVLCLCRYPPRERTSELPRSDESV